LPDTAHFKEAQEMIVLDTKKVDELIEILNKELAIYDDILKLSAKKTDVIVNGDVSELVNITRMEQSMVPQIGKLESERMQLVEQIAVLLNIKAEELTLTVLEKQLPGEQKVKLADCRKKLSDTINELKEANALNSKLIKNSLDYIDFSINVLTSAGASGNNYINSGVSQEPGRKNLFDMKL